MQLDNASDARWHASKNLGTVRDLEPITDEDGVTVLGWTFRAPGSAMRHGWVLTDGRVSPALTTYRDDAAQYGRDTAKDAYRRPTAPRSKEN